MVKVVSTISKVKECLMVAPTAEKYVVRQEEDKEKMATVDTVIVA